jgi:hypothetical protein
MIGKSNLLRESELREWFICGEMLHNEGKHVPIPMAA